MMRMISILLMLILVIGCSASDPVTSATPNDQPETPSATEAEASAGTNAEASPDADAPTEAGGEEPS